MFPSGTVLVHGACRGVDMIADEVGRELGFEIKKYPADWSKGRQAGMLRNIEMLQKENPDIVIAFHDFIEESKGTKGMLIESGKSKVKTMLIMA